MADTSFHQSQSASDKKGALPSAVPSRMPPSLSPLTARGGSARGQEGGDEQTACPPLPESSDLDPAGACPIQPVNDAWLGREIRKFGQRLYDGRSSTSIKTGVAALLSLDPDAVSDEEEALGRFLEVFGDTPAPDACTSPSDGRCASLELKSGFPVPMAPGAACAPGGDASILDNNTVDFSIPSQGGCAGCPSWPCNVTPRAVRYPTVLLELPEDPTPNQRRDFLFTLQRHLAKHELVPERCQDCLSKQAPNVDAVGVSVAPTWSPERALGRLASYTGREVCGRIHSCPVCGQRRGIENAHRMYRSAWNHLAAGRALYHLVLSLPHRRDDPPEKLLELIQEAWSTWNSGRHGPLSRHHCSGWIRVLEVTWGEHGPHFHFHVLVFRESPWEGTGQGWIQVPHIVGEDAGEGTLRRLARDKAGVWKERPPCPPDLEPLCQPDTGEDGPTIEQRWAYMTLDPTRADTVSKRLQGQAELLCGLERAGGLDPAPLDTSPMATWWTAAVTRWISTVEKKSPKILGRVVRPSVQAQFLESVPSVGLLPSYLAKAGFGVALEMGLAPFKRARSGGSRSPLQIAVDVATGGRPEDVALWLKHQQVMYGKSVVTCSQSSPKCTYERNPFVRYEASPDPPEVPRPDGWTVGTPEHVFSLEPWLYKALRWLELDIKFLHQVERLGPEHVAPFVEKAHGWVPKAAIPNRRLALRLAGKFMAQLRHEDARPPPDDDGWC